MFKCYPHLFLEDPEIEEEEEEEEVPPGGDPPPAEPPKDPEQPPTPPIDPAKASLEELAKTNPDVAKMLADKQESDNKLADLLKKGEEDERKKQQEQGKWQELYEDEQKKNADLSKELNKNQEILGKYQGSVDKILEGVMKTIPEERRGLIPSDFSSRQKLEYITQNAALLGAKVTGGDGGVPPSDPPPVATEEQQLIKEVQELADKQNKTAQEQELLWEKSQKLKQLQAQNQ